MINLKKIYKYYDNKYERTYILKNVNLDVAEGDFVSVMGPSGAGKSTLLNIIGLLDDPNEGEYFFLDQPAHQLNEKKKVDFHRHHVGFIFQAFHLIEEMTVYENIETPLFYKGMKKKERQAVIADLLDRFNMVAKKDLFPQQLSGGQQQLVGIARAIAGKPKLLLADEPTGNLHHDQGKMIMDLLKKLNDEGMTIIQVTHNQEFANYGKRIIRLTDGEIEEEIANS
ncbi:ABC transporter ATP-binding protein [Prolixibacter denitrificans]|uniref:ABC transporter ATP-binding protein n=1 Tax=Prolixibacter denitrificans TaxID=1541063 RepID=A0A2P8CHC4_9BACT|nr:ABC transporter ATP-binding protein [Prolixibacter denitrificans]PSK84312.1 ABC-type lipoprotein export system ATPase subunit [Prolixibacter denitrificans]GET20488.1 ABC transporter ATP-binding protein [Prolixibacter denitrificans]